MIFDLKISIVPEDGIPPDWRLHIIKALKDALESQPAKDYQIRINDIDPIIVDWKGKKKK